MSERELTHPVTLTLPNGHLNPDAVGWARQPLVDTTGIGRGRGRNKRWEYWNVTTPTHIVGLTVSSIDYAAVHEVWVLDRVTEQTWGAAATVIPPRHVELPATVESGRAFARAKELEIEVTPGTDGTRLQARIPGVSIDVVAHLPALHERLAVVVPWSSTRFQYTVKDVARPATGSLTIDGIAHQLPADDSWAVLDHGRGRWPYSISWNWGAGSGRSGGRVIGLQVGGLWTEGTGSTENSLYVDGRLHKIHEELTWDYDLAEWRRPWRVHGGGLEATFEPFYDKVTRTNFGVLAGRTDQCFGHWSGTYAIPDGDKIAFDQILGWAEEVHNRW